MNDMVRNAIDARKDAIFNAYDVKDKAILEKVEKLFKKIEELGEKSFDIADFETKFAKDTLNQEYINLFTEIATSCKPKDLSSGDDSDSEIKSDAEYILDDVASEVKYQLEDATSAVRHQAYQETFDKVRDIPGIGQAMEIKQHIDFFGRFGRKKKQDEDNNEEE